MHKLMLYNQSIDISFNNKHWFYMANLHTHRFTETSFMIFIDNLPYAFILYKLRELFDSNPK